jgi:hypothetical protein
MFASDQRGDRNGRRQGRRARNWRLQVQVEKELQILKVNHDKAMRRARRSLSRAGSIENSDSPFFSGPKVGNGEQSATGANHRRQVLLKKRNCFCVADW